MYFRNNYLLLLSDILIKRM